MWSRADGNGSEPTARESKDLLSVQEDEPVERSPLCAYLATILEYV
ncbi:hypothetical protein HMPREF0636_1336 [Porphyromonas catoniae ATCC 51270]|uniref:Uncharacterized protein n=1 Tax=Porphyromonas catoniae ATCC 51270 TaxID=887901 RepID=Z4X069_9PORP|nr:hypothetical protein HMPREF0636_1336 [Porphyromonas catoniae ATCC 51270]